MEILPILVQKIENIATFRLELFIIMTSHFEILNFARMKVDTEHVYIDGKLPYYGISVLCVRFVS